jgi:hypothetical protein
LENCSELKTIKDLQRFLGLIRFVRGYSPYMQKNASAYYNLSKDNPTRLKWTNEYSYLFYEIINNINTFKKSAHRNFKFHLAVTTDGSDTHIGGSLYQTDNIVNIQNI